jgi:hypothetical protein
MENICAVWRISDDVADRLFAFTGFGSRLGNKWIDETIIKSSPDNLRFSLKMYKMLHRIAIFEHLQPPFGGLDETVKFYKRLKGLVDHEDRLGFGKCRWSGKGSSYIWY